MYLLYCRKCKKRYRDRRERKKRGYKIHLKKSTNNV